MKLLTLNTHSLLEENYTSKTYSFVEHIIKEKVDVFAMQEVNQSHKLPVLAENPAGYYGHTMLKQNNHALYVDELLKKHGISYNWIWESCHLGYNIYDEGIALFSRYPILGTKIIPLSLTQSPTNYKTRKALAVCCQTENGKCWFVCVHMGWWKDDEEPFINHWHNLMQALEPLKDDPIFIMGDFNNRSDIQGEGYSLITGDNWHDLYTLAKEKDSGITSSSAIAGWFAKESEAIRIDYIFCNKKINVKSQKSIFNGINGPVISDHYAVLAECEIN